MIKNLNVESKETLEIILKKRLQELNPWEYQELKHIKIICEAHDLKKLIKEINENY